MPSSCEPYHGARPGRIGRLALLAVLLLGLAIAGHGQGTDNSPRHYFNERSFEIPFDVQNKGRVSKVILYTSSDGKTFKEYSTVDPRSAASFTYTAPGDGWFSFVVQVEDSAGGRTPPRVDESAVDLRVCVDTEKPAATLRPVAPQDGGTVAVEWEVKDNREIDLRKLRLDYRAVGDQRWTGLNIRQLANAQLSWSPRDAGEYEVRLSAYDMAKNLTQETTKVKASTGGSGTANNTPQPGTPRADKAIHVQKKKFKLQYKIDNVGPSKVKNVEVWWTNDTREWRIHADNAPPDPGDGFEVTVPRAGRHGFTLRPISGVGRAARIPSPNEQPQIWVEVDELPPVVKLLGVTVGDAADKGTITVTWDARDKWLRDEPITISYAASKDGPWQPLKANLRNTGTEKVPVKDDLFEVFIKVEAIDQAGNLGADQTRESVKVDLSEPTVKDIGIKPGT